MSSGGHNALALSGQRFGRVLVLERAASRSGASAWLCKCDCGMKFIATGPALKRGSTTSCSCGRIESIRKANTKHGLGTSRVYQVWSSMKSRCIKTNAQAYADYGGRGIKVCDRWMKFENFLADMGHPDNRMTLERINNNGNYEPGNCRWASYSEQASNRRNTNLLTLNGETKCESEWARDLGLKPGTIARRVASGWPLEAALTMKPVPPHLRRSLSLIRISST